MDRKIEHIRRLMNDSTTYYRMGFIIVDKSYLNKVVEKDINDKIFICDTGSIDYLQNLRYQCLRFVPCTYQEYANKIHTDRDHLLLVLICENRSIMEFIERDHSYAK